VNCLNIDSDQWVGNCNTKESNRKRKGFWKANKIIVKKRTANSKLLELSNFVNLRFSLSNQKSKPPEIKCATSGLFFLIDPDKPLFSN
jgi:hypothetical protein